MTAQIENMSFLVLCAKLWKRFTKVAVTNNLEIVQRHFDSKEALFKTGDQKEANGFLSGFDRPQIKV